MLLSGNNFGLIDISRIQELQEDIIKVKLELEKSQDCIEHLNQQVRQEGVYNWMCVCLSSRDANHVALSNPSSCW